MIIFNFVTDTDCSWPMIVLVECIKLQKVLRISVNIRNKERFVPSGCADRNVGANPVADDRARASGV